MTCRICNADTDDLHAGICFDCATEGDLRLGRRSVIQHWTHGIYSVFCGVWWRARMDFKMGWERLWRTGEYALGGEWQDL